MQPIDALTQRDKDTFKHYVERYSDVKGIDPDKALQEWNKNKRTLFKALGGKLRVKIPHTIKKTDRQFENELRSIYGVYTLWDSMDVKFFLKNPDDMKERIHNDFVFQYLKFIAEADWTDRDKCHASRLVIYKNIIIGSVTNIDQSYHFSSFNSTIKPGMRIIKAFQNVLKAMDFPHMDLFEEWKSEINDANCNHGMTSTIVLSIHPIDYITMSDNNCGWTSCMNWSSGGSYHLGTIEMMNSNLAVVAYFEAKGKYGIYHDGELFEIPNKSWRTLLFVHKYLLLEGKSYPYYNREIGVATLDFIRSLVEKNLGWHYQFINQEHLEMVHVNSNDRLRDKSIRTLDKQSGRKNPRAIYVYTNAMYNDFVEQWDECGLCCRNVPPHTLKLCLSGKLTCMCCGKMSIHPQYIEHYGGGGQGFNKRKICTSCRTATCDVCGQIDASKQGKTYAYRPNTGRAWEKIRNTYICSDECAKELRFNTTSGMMLKISDLGKGVSCLLLESSSLVEDQEIQDRIADLAARKPVEPSSNDKYTVKWMSAASLENGIIKELYTRYKVFYHRIGWPFLATRPPVFFQGQTSEDGTPIEELLRKLDKWEKLEDIPSDSSSTLLIKGK